MSGNLTRGGFMHRFKVGSIVRYEYEPWFLGFCRWSEHLMLIDPDGHDGYIYQEVARGSWCWRGFDAVYQVREL